ncbi:hypothetical protein EMCRGX_G022127 [Ephydatia muelleri]
MCIRCIKERLPDRGSSCLETGSYLLNYAGCSNCNAKGFMKESEKVSEVENDGSVERISYKHTCQECGHVIATHEYTFEDYTMDCDLCGHGEIQVSILPDDPREKQLY